MNLFPFLRKKCDTANLAKERLQVAVGHSNPNDIIAIIKSDILDILSKYDEVSQNAINFRHDKKKSMLKLAIPVQI